MCVLVGVCQHYPELDCCSIDKAREVVKYPLHVFDERCEDRGTIWQCEVAEARKRTSLPVKEAIKRAKQEGSLGTLYAKGRLIAEAAAKFKTNMSVGFHLCGIEEFC